MKELSEQELVRREKLKEISEVVNPYPERFEVTHTLLKSRELEDGTKDVSIAGRIVFMRKLGKLSFIKLRDLESEIQVQLKSDILSEDE